VGNLLIDKTNRPNSPLGRFSSKHLSSAIEVIQQAIAPGLCTVSDIQQFNSISLLGVTTMTMVDFSRFVSAKKISIDIDAFHALSTISNYTPVRSEATPEGIKAMYEVMLAKQQLETELTVKFKAAVDAARQAEVEFHDAVQAMKESVRAQFGPNSDEAQAVGYKKKSEYKRPRRRSTTV